jgi:hypothetical protein
MFETFLILVTGLYVYRFEVGGRLYWAFVYRDRFLLGLFKDEQNVLRKIVYFYFEMLYGSCLRLCSLNYGDLFWAGINTGIGSISEVTVLISEAGFLSSRSLFRLFLKTKGLLLLRISWMTVFLEGSWLFVYSLLGK